MSVHTADGIHISKRTWIILLILSIVSAWFGNMLGQAIDEQEYGIFSVLSDADKVIDSLKAHMSTPWKIDTSTLAMLCFGIFFFLPAAIYFCGFLASKREYMYNKEHGTARWGTPAEAAAFSDPIDPRNNIILSKNYRKMLCQTKHDPEHERNNNVLILGGPGAGKTRFVVKPNIMQLNASYVISDPKGLLPLEAGTLFVGGDGLPVPNECMYRTPKDIYEYTHTSTGKCIKSREPKYKAGDLIPYKLKILNLKDITQSHGYNPFAYMRSPQQIIDMVDMLIVNTSDDKKTGGDEFWTKAEALLYQALFGYLFFHCRREEQNLGNVMVLLNAAKAKEEDEDYMSPLDNLFYMVETGKRFDKVRCEWVDHSIPQPDSFAVQQYHKFKSAAGKTLKSILISANARLSKFSQEDVAALVETDELELDKLGDEPTVLFLLLPDTKNPYREIAAMCIYQLIDQLVEHADNDCGGKCQVPVQFLLDEFANIGGIKDFDKVITTLRSRDIGATIVLQNAGQLDRDYNDAARVIKGGCDTTVYLGGCDYESCEEISKQMGKITIAAASLSKTDGQQKSTSMSDQLIQRDLEDPAEVRRMSKREVRILISGSQPFKDTKYDIADHPNYKYIDPLEADSHHKDAVYKNSFDIESYILATRKDSLSKKKKKDRELQEKRRTKNRDAYIYRAAEATPLIDGKRSFAA